MNRTWVSAPLPFRHEGQSPRSCSNIQVVGAVRQRSQSWASAQSGHSSIYFRCCSQLAPPPRTDISQNQKAKGKGRDHPTVLLPPSFLYLVLSQPPGPLSNRREQGWEVSTSPQPPPWKPQAHQCSQRTMSTSVQISDLAAPTLESSPSRRCGSLLRSPLLSSPPLFSSPWSL